MGTWEVGEGGFSSFSASRLSPGAGKVGSHQSKLGKAPERRVTLARECGFPTGCSLPLELQQLQLGAASLSQDGCLPGNPVAMATRRRPPAPEARGREPESAEGHEI